METRGHTRANTAELRAWLQRERGVALADYDALWRWSVEHVSDFWQAMWDYFALRSPTSHTNALSHALSEKNMPGARWFEGAQLNYVRQILRHVEASDKAHAPALIFRNERLQTENRSTEISWSELAQQSAALAETLRELGVEKGDRVAAYLPNIPQAIAGFLACASLGAVWSLCATDMGVATVRDRFKQIAPKVFIACDGTVYGGKVADRRETVNALLRELPTVTALILVPYLENAGGQSQAFDAGDWAGKVLPWDRAVAGTTQLAPIDVPFSHPLWIVYSSGTTGMPKPIVHGHGGVLLEMLKLHRFHLDLQPSATSDERFHWYSSSGWVMWNLSISALLLGVTVCLYDGHPSAPAADTLWQFVDQTKVTTFGAGAAYYTACMKAGVAPKALASRVRTLGSTGSPLPADAYVWGRQQTRDDLWWAVISGGTDIASAFLGGTPELPTVPGEMQSRCLGADIQSWDEAGRSLIDEVGELVCVQPMPSMPLYFWGDDDGHRYRDSYFDVYPGVWRHGDWLRITPRGGAIIYGRSDATLNRHGHRLGTSELYRVIEALPEILDSVVVDLEYLGRPSWMPLFVVLQPGVQLNAEIEATVRKNIRESLSPRFVPDEVVQVAEIPRTLTGKKLELPIKKLLLGRALEGLLNLDACVNPAAFAPFEAYALLRSHAQDKSS